MGRKTDAGRAALAAFPDGRDDQRIAGDARTRLGRFGGRAAPARERNQLIWGDKKLVMSSLLAEFAGQVKLVYIDPSVDTGADFSLRMKVGDSDFTKAPSLLEEHAYRDTWGCPARRGTS